MIVRLNNGSTEIVNNMNDIKDLVSDDLFQAIEDVTKNEIDKRTKDMEEENDEDLKNREEEYDDLKEDIDKRENELHEAQYKYGDILPKIIKVDRLEIMINNIANINNDYKKSKSKRVDKDKIIEMLSELTNNLKGCVETC